MVRQRSFPVVAAAAVAGVCSVLFTGPGAAAGVRSAPGARPTVLGGTWGAAEEVPGTAALNTAGGAAVTSVSCGAAGNCAAGGFYAYAAFGHTQAFVVGQANDSWGTAVEVPGTAALNKRGVGELTSVSCASSGNCSAGGSYTDDGGQAFVANEVNGAWRTAEEAPGTAALNTGGRAAVTSVSCASAGNCSAGGHYTGSSGHSEAFVVSEVNGTWGTAVEVPGSAALNVGGNASISSVSCGAAGSCSAGGFYIDRSGNEQAFVVSQTRGAWGTAVEVPGTRALNTGGFAQVSSVSCGAAGNCAEGGFYKDSAGHYQAFVAGEVNGTWRTAVEVPGTAALNAGGFAQTHSVSCASAGNCSAGGVYKDSVVGDQAFVAGEVNGTWRTAVEVPGTAALNKAGVAAVASVSCASAGNCGAGGSYLAAPGHLQAFVADEVNGTWHTAEEVPGIAALNKGGSAAIDSISCTPAGECSAGGSYTDGSGNGQAFVVTRT
jgi:hypothetical protein